MKKGLIAALCIAVLLLTSCGATPQCEYDRTVKELKKAEDITVCIYEDIEGEKELDISELPALENGKGLAKLLSGKWEKCSGGSLGDKIVSFTLDTQYEICLFEGGKAMIYYGFCGVFEKDRQYYNIELDNDMADIVEYARENSEIIKSREEEK